MEKADVNYTDTMPVSLEGQIQMLEDLGLRQEIACPRPSIVQKPAKRDANVLTGCSSKQAAED